MAKKKKEHQPLPKKNQVVEASINGVYTLCTVTRVFSNSFQASLGTFRDAGEKYSQLSEWREPGAEEPKSEEKSNPRFNSNSREAELTLYPIEDLPFEAILLALRNYPQSVNVLASRADTLAYKALQALKILEKEGDAARLHPNSVELWILPGVEVVEPNPQDFTWLRFNSFDHFAQSYSAWGKGKETAEDVWRANVNKDIKADKAVIENEQIENFGVNILAEDE